MTTLDSSFDLEQTLEAIPSGTLDCFGRHLIDFVRALDQESPVDFDPDTLTITIKQGDLARRRIADLCGLRSTGSTQRWVQRWRKNGWLHGVHVDLSLLLTQTIKPTEEAKRDTANIVASLLAYADTHPDHAPRMFELIETELARIDAPRTDRSARAHAPNDAPDAPNPARHSACSKPEISPYTHASSQLASYELDPERTPDELAEILAPLADTIERFGLTGTNDYGAIAAISKRFTNTELVTAVTRTIRTVGERRSTGSPIAKPFGFLVHMLKTQPDEITMPNRVQSPTPTQRAAPIIHLADFENPANDDGLPTPTPASEIPPERVKANLARLRNTIDRSGPADKRDT